MPVPQLLNSLVGWASCPLFATGKMPVPQLINPVVGWASCPSLQQARCLFHN
ncbi:MAG: hypothetical protein QQW96_12225 [Tychonema bourrellyi B0820]|uniref:hypothetical protein n=1 Tax=Tychonema bourrellyi TaxID=54313 RepID=UPI0015D4C435|nr:hypothetical protein [Tychonema bourrellyi]MDQ2098400.1 hypothetical protein [Tychonema bourrellyi B0820]